MWIIMDEKYRVEKERFNFKGSCEDCRHYCEKRDLCAMLYPVLPHKKISMDNAKNQERIYFCKMFEAQ